METAESSRLSEFAWKSNIKMVLTKRKNVGMDVKTSRNISRYLVRPACIAGVPTSRPNRSA